MPQSHRGQFGPGSLLALLALAAGSAVAEPLPPLRVNPSLLGAGTPPPAPAVAEPAAIAKPVGPTPRVVEAPPPARVDLTAEQPRGTTAAAPSSAPQPARSTAPTKPAAAAASTKPGAILPTQAPASAPASPAAIAETPRRPPEPKPQPLPQATPAEAIQKPQEPPQVAERTLPPLYSAHVAAGELPDPRLTSTSVMMPWLKSPGETLPTFVAADRIAGQTDVELVADGNVELRKRNSNLKSDRLTYRQPIEEIEAEGNVRLSRDGDHIQGPRMRMQMEESTGFFEQPEYSIRRIKTGSAPTLWTGTEERRTTNPSTGQTKSVGLWTGDEEVPATDLTTGHGSAARMEFEGEGKYRLTDATYSTCAPVAGHDPDWFVRTTDLRLDYDAEEATARNATLVFLGTPIFYSPWLSFSLNNERKSGLLTPTAGSTSKGGIEFTQPFYWNIAPNMDATIAPRYMEKRGMLWNGEYRYLQPEYSGIVRGQYLNQDKLENDIRRSFYSVAHRQNLGYGFYGTLDLNGVSDDTYFSDLGSGSAVVSRTNLLRQGTLSYSGGWWSANLLAQRYQTLQDPDLPPVTEPYRRLPQLTVSASRGDLPLGMAFAFQGEYVDFRSANRATNEGKRITLYPQFSLPLQTDILSITPKVGLHSTRYDLDTRYNPAGAIIGGADTLTRNVPIFSVDSGVTFERGIEWQGKSLTQTLEPRLYYLYVPNRDQDRIPVFDTGITDYNFAQTFAENRYSGGDRIGDANQLTAMLSSRLLDPETGAETMRAAFGQRFYFTDQKVGLPATSTSPAEQLRTDRYADLLGSFSGRILPKTFADANLQYSPQVRRMERFNVGARYQPEAGKVLNAGYRYTRDQLTQPGLSQFDVSGQWPLAGGWHGVGRINYSIKESRMIETVAGLEYDGGCWIGRVVFQRLATQENDSNTSFFVQLEFNGFAKVGTNPLEMLKRNVPGYGVINQQNSESPIHTP